MTSEQLLNQGPTMTLRVATWNVWFDATLMEVRCKELTKNLDQKVRLKMR